MNINYNGTLNNVQHTSYSLLVGVVLMVLIITGGLVMYEYVESPIIVVACIRLLLLSLEVLPWFKE